jgi:hypothetical protein
MKPNSVVMVKEIFKLDREILPKFGVVFGVTVPVYIRTPYFRISWETLMQRIFPAAFLFNRITELD